MYRLNNGRHTHLYICTITANLRSHLTSTTDSDVILLVTFLGGNLPVFYAYDMRNIWNASVCTVVSHMVCHQNFSKTLCYHVNATPESVSISY